MLQLVLNKFQNCSWVYFLNFSGNIEAIAIWLHQLRLGNFVRSIIRRISAYQNWNANIEAWMRELNIILPPVNAFHLSRDTSHSNFNFILKALHDYLNCFTIWVNIK